MSSNQDNFIDKAFMVIADLLIKLLPVPLNQKRAFAYYRKGMTAHAEGEYAEALENYFLALSLEEDLNARSYILYNIALIYGRTGSTMQAIDFYLLALDANPFLCQAWNNLGVIYHALGIYSIDLKEFEVAQSCFSKAARMWRIVAFLEPDSYPEVNNWLKINGLI